MKNYSIGRLFLNAVALESRSPGSVVTNKRNTTDPGTLRAARLSSMTSFYNGQKPSICLGGFTLIELLVVVLIIGLLSAIALPQYQKAVMKSKMVQGFVTLRAIDTAQEEYFLANGVYSDDLDNLSISVDRNYLSCPAERQFCILYIAEGLQMELAWTWSNREERLRCLARAGTRAEEICASFGGHKFRESEGINYYTLPYK